jgi:Putative Ig domain
MNLSSRALLGSRRGRVAVSAFAGCCLCGLVLAVPADAAASGPVPTLDCVATSPDGTQAVAYFGYVNSTGSRITIPEGNDNQAFPLSPDQGEPTEFDPGSYPAVFSIAFDPVLVPTVSWFLDGGAADASSAPPQCEPGTTSPASDLTPTSATLNGVIAPGGTDVTYTFEYGTATTYGSTTAVVDAGSGDAGELVQSSLTGLAPATTYYYRLDTTTTYGGSFQETVDGAQQQFTTPATPAPAPTVTVTEPGPTVTATVTATPAPAPTVTVTQTPAPAPTVTVTVPGPTVTATPTGLALDTTALPNGTVGVRYSATLSVSGGTLPYQWQVTRGFLPLGLSIDRQTGVLSGRPLLPGTYQVTITVTDSSVPARESLSERYTIKIAR